MVAVLDQGCHKSMMSCKMQKRQRCRVDTDRYGRLQHTPLGRDVAIGYASPNYGFLYLVASALPLFGLCFINGCFIAPDEDITLSYHPPKEVEVFPLSSKGRIKTVSDYIEEVFPQ